jgi:hypothetical protein
VDVGADGRALLYCHAGCATEDVVKAAALSVADLFEDPVLVASPPAPRSRKPQLFAVKDTAGTVQAIHVREDTASGKRMSWRRPDGTPGLNGTPAKELPLFGSEQLTGWDASAPILLVEGEKAAIALLSAGHRALATVTGAASAPSAAVLESLRGRDVVLWPDADAPGREHMDRIAGALHGVANSVRHVAWSGAPEHGDAADYIAAGLDVAQLLGTAANVIQTTADRLGAQRLLAISTDPAPPLVVGRLDPHGHTIAYGPGGVGKGTVATWWMLRAVQDGHRFLIADYENHPEEWARRVHGLGGAEILDAILWVGPLTAAWTGTRGALWQQRDELRALAEEFRATYLLVDSIVPACGGVDSLKPEAAAQYAGGLEYIGLPALSLAHTPKDGNLSYPFGSSFWHNLARVTWSMQSDSGAVLLTNQKANNYAKAPKQRVTITWQDGRPVEVWEQHYTEELARRIERVLEARALTVREIVNALNDELDDDGATVKDGSVRQALNRGLKEPARFAKEGERWSLA